MANESNLPTEPVDGGLVTSRDPALLSSGELTLANNAIYLPDDPAIHKVKGRTKYNTAAMGAGGNVKGLRYLEFDDSSSILAAHEADDIHLSQFSAETGTFATLTAVTNVGSGTTMDSVHYGNRHILLTGAGQNTVVKQDGTNRKHGMAPVPELITTPTTTTGVWNSVLGTGFYHFLYTEVIKDTVIGIDLESAFTGNPKSVNVTSVTAQSVTVTKNGVTYNTGATHWRIYMAGPTVAESPTPPLSDFRLVSELDIATTSAVVGNQVAAAGILPTANTTATAGWSNVSNVFSATDNAGMRSSTNNSAEYLRAFGSGTGFSGLTGTVQGFEVFIRFRIPDFVAAGPLRSTSPLIIVDLTHNGTNFYPGNNSRYVLCRSIQGAVGGYVTVVLGNPYDLWGRTGSPAWALADLNANASFGIRVKYGQEYAGTAAILDIDWIRVAVHTTGSSRPVNLEGRGYRITAVNVGGIQTVFSSDLPPPVATTGDIFEGQLILNDVADPSLIRGSLPDEIESFPGPYLVNFETKERDEVTCFRRVGNKGVVGMTHQMYRLNYFPRETDAEFDRGRCYEAISEHHGIVGPMAATLFSPDGTALLLAVVSHDGLHVTDGFQLRKVSHDLDWDSVVRLPTAADVTNYLRTAILVNYPVAQQLWMYYTPPGSTTNSKAMVFHYNRRHVKEDGTFKATGPIDVAAFSACLARLAGADVLLTGQSGGFAYVEDRGYTHNAGGTIPFAVQTREMYLGGFSHNVTLEGTYVRHRSDSPTSTITVTPITRKAADAQVTQTAKTFTNANGGVAHNPWQHTFDSLQLKLSEPGADSGGAVRISLLTLEVYGHGLQERRS